MPPLLTVKLVVSLSLAFIDIFDLVEALTLGGGVSNGLLSSFLLVGIVDFNTFCCFLLTDKAERNKGLLSYSSSSFLSISFTVIWNPSSSMIGVSEILFIIYSSWLSKFLKPYKKLLLICT